MAGRAGRASAAAAVLALFLGPGPAAAQGKVAGLVAGVPTVVAADTLRFEAAGGVYVRLEAAVGVQYDQWCGRGDDRWRCGAEAASWLALWIRGRAVTCVLRSGGVPAVVGDLGGGPGTAVPAVLGDCECGGEDVAGSVVRAGWGLAADPMLHEEQQAARDGGRGVWASVVVHPERWLAERLRAIEAWGAGRR